MRFVYSFFLICILAVPAVAQDRIQVRDPQNHMSAKDLINLCKGQYDIDYGYCAGYLAAVSEVMLDHEVYGQAACNHGPVASQQLMELFRESVKNDPSKQMQPASVASAQMLARYFECR